MKVSATCVLSFDVSAVTRGGQPAAAPAVLKLLDRVLLVGLPATWALDIGSVQQLGPQLAAAGDQELAIFAGSDLAHDATNQRLSASLKSALHAVRSVGQPATSLTTSAVVGAPLAEALVRAGISAVRGPQAAPRRRGPWARLRDRIASPANSAPTALRWGLRLWTPTLAIPVASAGQARRALQRTTTAGGLLLVAIDAQSVSEQSASRQAELLDWLDDVGAARASAGLEVVNLATANGRLEADNHGRPTRSILRAA